MPDPSAVWRLGSISSCILAVPVTDRILIVIGVMGDIRQSRVNRGEHAVALYHVVYGHEGFDEAAQALFKLVRDAQRLQPGRKRKLFLDIDGHRNSEAGFDADMLELQREFLIGFLAPFLAEVHCPMISMVNPEPQRNDFPAALAIRGHDRGRGPR